GTQPGAPTVALAQQIADAPNLRFAGVMSWEGHAVSMKEHDVRHAAIEQAIAQLVETADACRAAGLPVEIVSCGGSGTYLTTAKQQGITEIQAGGATLGDIFYRELLSPAEPALSLMVQVISRPIPERIIFDAGRKTVDPSTRAPEPRGIEGVVGLGLSAEHGTLKLDRPNTDLAVGDRIYFDIGYHDQALHLHENLYVVQNGKVVGIWPTLARGKIQ
ncbi:MAG: alanine racemase, partial [Thermomicrobiales bacterium]